MDSSVNQSLRQIVECLESPLLSRFVSDYDELLASSSTNECLSYFGINFTKGRPSSVKFYVHTFEQPGASQILKFLPHPEDFNRFIKDRPTYNHNSIFKNVGIAFELKFDLLKKITGRGFFFLQNLQDMFSFPARLPEAIMRNCIARGINFEYAGSHTLRKDYMYFHTHTVLSYFKERFGVSLLSASHFIEYAESNTFSKLNAYGPTLFDLSLQSDFFTQQEQEIIHYLNQTYDLVNLEFGVYENLPLKSVYFFDGSARDTNGILNLETLQYNLHALKRFI